MEKFKVCHKGKDASNLHRVSQILNKYVVKKCYTSRKSKLIFLTFCWRSKTGSWGFLHQYQNKCREMWVCPLCVLQNKGLQASPKPPESCCNGAPPRPATRSRRRLKQAVQDVEQSSNCCFHASSRRRTEPTRRHHSRLTGQENLSEQRKQFIMSERKMTKYVLMEKIKIKIVQIIKINTMIMKTFKLKTLDMW